MLYNRKIKKKNKEIFSVKDNFFVTHYKENGKVLFGCAIFLVFVLATWTGMNMYYKKQAVGLSDTLYFDLEESDLFQKEADLTKIREYVSNSEGTGSYAGSMKLAGIYYFQKRYSDAVREFERVIEKTGNKFLKFGGSLGLGYSFEGAGEYDKAINVFTELAQTIGDTTSFEPYRMLADIAIARCYEGKGENQEALKRYESFKEIYPDSQQLKKVAKKIEILKLL